MRALRKFAVAFGVVGVMAVAGVVPASADWYHRHHYPLRIRRTSLQREW